MPHLAARRKEKARGFSLIELVVTLAILGVLAAAAAPVAQLAIQRTKESDLRTALRDIRTGIDAYKRAADEGRIARKADESGYPPSLDVLVDGVADIKRPDQRKIFFMRRIPPDPFSDDRSGKPSQTWGLRSSTSTAESPQAGSDVFDVYSRAPGAGLNGIPFREW